LSEFKIAIFGDIVGEPGRKAFREGLEILKKQKKIDFLIVNGENSAGGIGITPKIAEFFFDYGVHIITTGNHIFRHKEIIPYLEKNEYLLRPHNYPEGVPGSGVAILEKNGLKIGVLNLCGRVFMEEGFDSPFLVADKAVQDLKEKGANVILVDFHAEATSEKQALGHYLDGKVTAVYGTHTHVQTADEKILPKGTAYISDIGFCGATFSLLGMDKDIVMKKFLLSMPVRFQVGKQLPYEVNGIVLTLDSQTGKLLGIERFLVNNLGINK
jgi:metallophosphoesterase (TIGR00282 family)